MNTTPTHTHFVFVWLGGLVYLGVYRCIKIMYFVVSSLWMLEVPLDVRHPVILPFAFGNCIGVFSSKGGGHHLLTRPT